MATTIRTFPNSASLQNALDRQRAASKSPAHIPADRREHIISQLIPYVSAIFEPDDIVEIRLLPWGESRWCEVRDLLSIIPWMYSGNLCNQNVYIGLNPRPAIGAKGDTCIITARSLCVDFDGINTTDAMRRIESAGPPRPTVILNSGHGCWAYWRLAQPMDDLGRWSQFQRGLAHAVGSDPKIHNPERIARLPGFKNHKPPTADAVLIESDHSRVYPLGDLTRYIPTAKVDERLFAPPVPATINEGQRNNLLMSLAGTMRRRGMDQASIEAALLAENRSKCDPALSDDEVKAIAASVAKYDPAEAMRTNSRWSPMPVHLFPEAVRAYVEQTAAAAGCDNAMVAMPLIAALGSAIGNARQIRLKDGWDEPPIIWSGVIARSGSKKSPGMKLATRHVMREQQRLTEKFQQQFKDYEHDLAAYNTMDKAKRPPEKPSPPKPVHVVVSDTTFEALADRLRYAPHGLLAARDELSGFLKSFGEYKGGNGSDVQGYLSCFNASPMKIDRKTGDQATIFIPRPHVSITGTIQPGILRRAFTGEFFDNGLAARFLLAMPPDYASGWTEGTIERDTIESIDRLFIILYGLQSDSHNESVTLTPTPAALKLFKSFVNRNGDEINAMSDDRLRASWSKLEAYAARLALILQLVRDALTIGEQPPCPPPVVDVTAMESGISLVEWFKGETRRIYAMLDYESETDHRRELVEYIRSSGGSVTVRELQRHSRKYATSEAAEAALEQLVGAGLGRWEVVKPDGPGQPSRVLILALLPVDS
jgi:Protein of unknown function (DUF3987)/Primase C terminal 1 (PriCT-1)/RepB DNA-primase from phage plasmid